MVTRARAVGPAATDARERAVWDALRDVSDPEIPALSVVDLGIIRTVAFSEDGGDTLRVEIMPTFVGCPALDVIRQEIGERLRDQAREVEVTVTFEEPWTSERITAEGRRKLRDSGFAPPAMPANRPPRYLEDNVLQVLPTASLPVAECPYCGSRQTTLDNAFGPTLCRAIYYCGACRQPFEQFKSV